MPATHALRSRARRAVVLTTIAGAAALGLIALATVPAAAPALAAAPSWLPTTPANWSTVVTRTVGPDRSVTAGVTLHSDVLDTVTGRVPGQVLEVDAGNPNVRLGVVGAGDTLIDPADEKISSMAARTGAVAGINGGYFDVNASGQPTGGEIIDGEIWKSPQHGVNGTFVLLADGTSAIHAEDFSGTITDGAASHPLFSINWPADATKDQLTEVTPRLGGPTAVPAGSVYVHGTSPDGGRTIVVSAIDTLTSLPAAAAGTAGLLGSATAATWLTANVHVGDTVTVGTQIAPDNDIQQLIQGPGQLVKDGKVFTDPTNSNPSGLNPETVLGVSKDGRHLTMVALDGRGTEATGIGVTPAQAAGYMVDLGVDSAVLLDGGGSTGLVARTPGQTQAVIQNHPSDNTGERLVGDGLFVYSRASGTGSPATATVNDGQALTGVVGVPTPVSTYVADGSGNPVTGVPVTVTATPASLGTWHDGTFTPASTGSGALTVRAGSASSSIPLTVAAGLSTLAASPAAPDLGNGETASLTLTGSTADGAQLAIPASSAAWTDDTPALGTLDTSTGAFTAAASGDGLATLTAAAGGATATISVAVGSKSTELNPFDNNHAWTMSISGGAGLSARSDDPDVPPGSTHATSTRGDYTLPGTAGVHQVILRPGSGTTIVADNNELGQSPTAIGVWSKITDPVHDGVELALSYTQANTTAATTTYNNTLVFGSWQLVTWALPAGTVFPVKVNFIDLLNVNPTKASGGDFKFSSVQELYSARGAGSTAYTPIPKNPSWLTFEESPSDFSDDGTTILMGDDAHMTAANSDGASAHVMDDIAARVKGTALTDADGDPVAPLPAQARPDVVQTLGDMSDDGKLPDLQFAQGKIAAIGVPYHDLVGNHEITQGADAENLNFEQVFGKTHYSYTTGKATVIASDNSHEGITASDPFQVPAEMQYAWLTQQLDAVTTPVAIVAVHMPAYDPFPAKNSQFSDRWEAQQYMQIVKDYQDAHPAKHVIMVYGHARGFSEQILDPAGDAVPAADGVPQLVFGDLGMPAYTAPEQGGFYHFGLVHITDAGDIQFAVEPVLESMSIDAITSGASGQGRAAPVIPTVAPGATLALTAHGTNQEAGPSATLPLAPVVLPIANPVSHVWTSSDPRIATVDRVTGVVTGVAPGTARISLEAGGVSTSVVVTVSGTGAGAGAGSGSGGASGGVSTAASTGPKGLAVTGLDQAIALIAGIALLLGAAGAGILARRRAAAGDH